MINLNDDAYNEKKIVTENDLFEIISEFDIFDNYIEDMYVNSIMKSPLRKDDNPSFNVFWSNKYQKLMFKDFGTGDRGGCITLLMRMFNISYKEALEQVVIDFGLEDKFITTASKKVKKAVINDKDRIKNIIKKSVDIQVKARVWNSNDAKYWNQYGISKATLKKFRVFPIKYIFINREVYKAEKYAYAYMEKKDNVIRFKIYQPYSLKMKWIGNLIEGTLSGFSQLNKSGNLLIIASSLKDGMCLHDLGIKDIISPQTENYIFKEHIVSDLKRRFKNIVLFYDNDEAGIVAAKKISELYDIKYINTGSDEYKDPSDYYCKFGKKETIKMIKKLL